MNTTPPADPGRPTLPGRSLPGRSLLILATLAITAGWLGLASAAPADAQGGRVRELPAEGGPLEPGRYATDVVGPGLTFTVGNAWRLAPPVDGPVLVLERVDMPGAVMTLTRFEGDAFAASCDPTSLTWVAPSAARLVDIIAGDPRLHADEPEAIEVDGLPGLSLDVTTPPLEDCGLPFLLIWALQMQDGEFVQVPGQQSRFIVLDVGSDVLVVAIETFPDVPFGFFASAAMDVVASLRIRPAGPDTTDTPPGPSPAP